MDIKESIAKLREGTAEIISEEELAKKLKKERPLTIKFGADPSAPDIHLGHTVVLRKLKQLQDMGHNIVFLIGDFTAMIGDPTGKSETRKQLSSEDVKKNALSYQEQVFKVLDKNKTKVVYNSEWLNNLSPTEFIKLTAQHTVARMLERDDFKKRYANNQPISIHEFLYPLLQGYDSVILKADLELGGTDQKFNLLVGRQLQENKGQEPQALIMMPILEGTDGVNKMSKSLGNHIGLADLPSEMFGKLMSIGDEQMETYYKLLTDLNFDKEKHPRDSKIILAKEIIRMYHNAEAAENAAEEFNTIFAKKGVPTKVPEITIKEDSIGILQLISKTGLCESNGESKRLIKQMAVSLNDVKISDINQQIEITGEQILKVGKRRFIKILKG